MFLRRQGPIPNADKAAEALFSESSSLVLISFHLNMTPGSQGRRETSATPEITAPSTGTLQSSPAESKAAFSL